jgi:hypothetical protein
VLREKQGACRAIHLPFVVQVEPLTEGPPTMTAPTLLNDDGTASMATPIMMSHHAFRRDLVLFERALQRIAQGDTTRLGALKEEWAQFRAHLSGHHQAEDNGLFPALVAKHPKLQATIERLDSDHRRIDPLLELGDTGFAALPATFAAIAVVRELIELLGPHLAIEEAELIPWLRNDRTFPVPPTDADAETYAKGFAWAIHGIAPDVIEQLLTILPESLRRRLPAARTVFERRYERVWGSAKAGAARTPIPDLESMPEA